MKAKSKKRITRKPAEGVAIIVQGPDGRVLVSDRTDPAAGFYGYLQFPGGGVNRGEAPLVAAVRELREETGEDIPGSRFQYLGSDERPNANGIGTYIGHCFRVYTENGERFLNQEPHKQTQWMFYTPEMCHALRACFIPGLLAYLK